MKHLLCLFVLLALVGPAVAQAPEDKLPGERILYSDRIPRFVLKRMPKHGKTCFYGSFKIDGQTYLLHLINRSGQPGGENGYWPFVYLRLHIFKKNKNKIQLERSDRLAYQSMIGVWDYNKYGAQLLWLDPHQKTRPILKLDSFVTGGEYGDMGDQILVVFSHGLRHRPKVQSLAFGQWRAGDADGQGTTYTDIDKRGLLELHTSLYAHAFSDGAHWTLHWNGRQFYPVNGPIKGFGIDPGLPYP